MIFTEKDKEACDPRAWRKTFAWKPVRILPYGKDHPKRYAFLQFVETRYVCGFLGRDIYRECGSNLER